MARIDAKFLGLNRLEITTSDVGAFTLVLAGHPKYAAGKPLQMTINGRAVKAGKNLSFSARNGAWANAPAVSTGNVKRRGAEGPIASALGAHHIYVYGTADVPSQEDLVARRAVAMKAAEWSTPRSRLLLSLRVLADRDVKPSDLEGANLVLFGTKETNSIIASLAAKLPLELNAGAADYGLTYVFPNGAHYVVINSGLPWWTGSENVRKTGFRFTPGAAGVADWFGDYVLIRGSVEDVVATGRFDTHWQLPPADAAKVSATGAVTIRK